MAKFCQEQISIPSILKIGSGELNYLGKYLKEYSFTNIACFYSAGIEDIYGSQIDESFKNSEINIMHKETIEDVDIESIIHRAFLGISKEVDALVGIGGGKALDYSKYCAHILGLPFISVPTSTSNDGFCSPGSSLLVAGKRKSVKATIPFGVVVDLDAVKSSPDSCIYSGIGDLISKITSSWDWKEAVKQGNEEFHDFAYLISQNAVIDFLNYQHLNIRSTNFLYFLVNALLMSGISMEIAKSSRPASGSEHLISHALDVVSKMPRMHGIQVGLATYLCSILQNNNTYIVKQFLDSTGFWDHVYANPLDKNDFIDAIQLAPRIKEGFYSVLSIPEKIEEAILLIETDEILKRALK